MASRNRREPLASGPAPRPDMSATSTRKRKAVALAADADLVLRKCRQLRQSLEAKAEIESSVVGVLPEGIPSDIVEVVELPATQVLEGMEAMALHIAQQVLERKGFSLEIPSRAASNQIYVKEWDRIVLGGKRSSRSFLNVKESRKSAITLRVMQLLHAVLMKRIHITKRDLFYTDVKLFVDQAESDGVLDDVATMIGCTRSNLHVVASDKGLVVGRIQFEEDGDFIDCTKMGVGGKAIPPYIDKIENIASDAEFILLVEKEAAYMRMAEDRFYHRYPCIIITAKGQPDVATRMFLARITSELKIPVLGLVDSDPYGLKILSVYMSGSKNMSYDSASLTTPDIKWLGLRPSDLDKYDLPEQCRLDMTENDIKTGKEMMKEDFIQKNPEWMKELEIMVKTKKKAEIQALSSFGFQYVTEQYLPRKLKEGDWI
ncbi:type II DNA topoisomerase VI subunit [Phaeodactylum tricornutum CCAP 1055/1]|uniref:DNA topoisomerase (ATP-hydrolyzing) n=3 Tax=Phaeodactylum tricornutum TaxID=2850 RepID=B7FQ86_PHATC|nr:type II DNA topoisomerase VI subunit [Phaeodactylum tricornutum CCAP 1055/1]EEC51815.1 type II DNA topoisomerase VI subunit [Phaeodactylum tricornutum CCAP 1055/1]|eukprot:XP_002177352.1 type II DNA topoisomerase VI subunit [Phaeodactylum tricornutum CCAP 1055/1]